MSRIRNSRGVTLVELVLTIVIVSFGLIGLMIIFENATRGVMQADLNVIASNLAHEKLEQIIVDHWRDGYAELDGADYPPENFQDEFSVFTRSTTIEEVSGDDFTTPEPTRERTRIGQVVLEGTGTMNHFHPDYRQPGEKWTLPRLDLQRRAFLCAREAFADDGGFIGNASRRTQLDVFPLVDFDQLVQ